MELKDALREELLDSENRIIDDKENLKKSIHSYAKTKSNPYGLSKRDVLSFRNAMNNQAIGGFIEVKLADSLEQRKRILTHIRSELENESRGDEYVNLIMDSFIYALDIDLTESESEPPVENADEGISSDINENSWTCICGTINNQNYCVICGIPKVDALKQAGHKWICSCGKENHSRFCIDCGRREE